jgi:hypothetical protein
MISMQQRVRIVFGGTILVYVFVSSMKTGPSGHLFSFHSHSSHSPARSPSDPIVAATIGFFLQDWQPRTFAIPDYQEVAVASNSLSASDTVTVDAAEVITKIPPSEFGHNANTWMTSMVSEPAFMNHVKNLHPHIIRFPAGSGSDVYFWNRPMPAIPPDVPLLLTDKDGHKKYPGFMFGKLSGPRNASLDDYYRMLQETGNQGLLTVNYGYARYGTSANPVAAAAHLAADWVRYDHGRTQYWEIGNENFGDWEWGYRIDTAKNKDGQPEFLTGQLYAQHFSVFADSMRKAAAEAGRTIYIGAVTYDVAPVFWQTNTTKTWNSGMMRAINGKADFYAVHSYFTPYNTNSNAADILYNAATVPAKMMNYVTQTLRDNGGALKPIAMDEWNMFAVNSKQQVSNVSGVFAVIVMGEALKNKYGMAARWDMFNGWADGNDHGLFSAGDEPGVEKWSPRPSFYYLYFLQKMLGDRLVSARVHGDTSIRAYATTFSSGQTNVILANTSASPRTVNVNVRNFNMGHRYYWYRLEGGTDNGEFSRKVIVNGHGTTGIAGGPADYASLPANAADTKNGLQVTVPARGGLFLTIDGK